MTQEATPPSAPFQLFGDSDPTLVVGGHSHAAAMMRAFTAGLTDPEAERVAVAYTDDWSAPSTADYFDFLVEATAGRTVAFSFSGNEHNAWFLLKRRPPFRVYDPEARYELGDEEGIWVARSTFRRLWTGSFELLHEMLPRLSERSEVLVLATPPPKSDDLVRKALTSEPHFLQQAAELGYPADELEVTPAITRVALWRVLDELLQEKTEAAGATFVPIPDGTTDEDGVLLPEFDFGDATHANAAYGALVWKQLHHVAPVMTP